ncbi:MAG: FtsX-like permease family protein [Lachnospiraceae bacterium]|nr:FtsX-like permease family protein [Lachnospiraceae bacterium]
MLRVMLQKLWHKKWMVLCLLLGSLLLIATVVSFPMYRSAAFDRMLQDEFENRLLADSKWPAYNSMVMISKKDKEGSAIDRMEGLMAEIHGKMGVTEKNTVMHYALAKAEVDSLMDREDLQKLSLRLGMLSELPQHAKMLSGEMYSEDGLDEDGCIEVVISQACMVSSNLLIGEHLEFSALKDAEGNPIRMKVTGVYDWADSADFYWQVTPDELDGVCLMEEELFHQYFTGKNAAKYTITCKYFPMFEYENLKAGQVAQIQQYTQWLTEESPYRSTVSDTGYLEVLDSFVGKQERIEATLFILQVPVLILLCAFLFMISGQMYEMERNEISVIKSRGASGSQIFRLYLFQSIFLTLLGCVLGMPLGSVFCRMLGSAGNFLEFNMHRELEVVYTDEVMLYALWAVVGSVLIMTVPALKHSRLTIVKLKQQKALKKSAWWEKFFLDVICLGVSLYGFYNYQKNQEALVQNVLRGEALDPLLYLSSSLFIVGMGLLFLRLQPIVIKVIYQIGKRFWKPASYASFTENLKNGKKQQFIMLFMILTISLGMFHATVARTILQNARENAAYLSGADFIIKEKWEDNSSFASKDSSVEFQYFEPDYSKYAAAPGVQSYTRVIFDERAVLSNAKGQGITLMGIHTKEFGMNTSLPVGLTEKHYYTYLNELAVNAQGLLVSRNFESILGYKVGDTVEFKNSDGNGARGKIVGFFDYWPGYAPTTTSLNPDGSVATKDNYVVVAHYSALQQKWGTVPYEVWITMKEGADTQAFKAWVQDENMRLVKFGDKEADLKTVSEDPLLQGTNGVLTMGFIVTIILCGVGYLIYWIMSIRSREMLFGVLRACGMHKGELFHMLINEQIFSGLFSVAAGIGIGKVASDMYVPILQTAYAAANQILPMKLITNPEDLLRLYSVIGIVVVVCLAVLIALVFKLNVAKALKLGEE